MKDYFMGIDVSKGYADFVILDKKKWVVEQNFQLDDTFEGHTKLYNVLETFLVNHPKGVLYCGVESTGGYENNWYHSLHTYQKDLNVYVARVNPRGVKHHSEAGLKRNKTDKMSAQNVAEYLIVHREKVNYEKEDYYASARKQWKFVALLKKQKCQMLNHMESVLYSAHTQLLKYCRNGIPQWVLNLIIRYPTALQLSRARIAAVSKIPYISLERAGTVVADAKRSVASATDNVIKTLILNLAGEIVHLQGVIKEQTRMMVELCNLPEVALLKSFQGIGDFSAIGLLIEIGVIERFPTIKHLASFFGLHPVYRISGDGMGAMRMSKQGRTQPRWILFNVALSAITCNPHIRSIYLELVENGMNKMAAIGVIMHKILRIIYGMLKNNQPYQPEIDQANRATLREITRTQAKDKSRRYQTLDRNAPISRRQKKKRNEREQSHNDHIIKSGIIAPANQELKIPQELLQIIQRFASRNL